ncbi:MAG: GtrA family protein [Nanoarchaeota archaeon]
MIKKLMKSQFFRFLVLGGWSYIFKVALTAFFLDLLGISPEIGYAIVVVLVVVVNYFLNFYVIFENKGGHRKKFVGYVVANGLLNALDYVLVNVLISLGMHYALAIFIAGVIGMLIKFLVFRQIVFRK